MKSLLFTLSFFCTFSFTGKTQITFEKTYGTPGGDFGYFAQQTVDGGYILVGAIDLWPSPEGIFLVKTNETGDTTWTRIFPDATGYCVKQTSDNGFIISGKYGNTANTSAYLLKTDSVGNFQWEKTFGTTNLNEAYSVEQSTDGGYILSGVKNYNSTSFTGLAYLIKTDSAGNTTWTKTFGGPLDSRAYSVMQTSDSGYILGGYTLSGMGGTYDMYFVKTNSSGDTLWTKKPATPGPDQAFCIRQTSDLGYIITGISNIISPEYLSLIKTDPSGNIVWNKNHGANGSSGRYVIQTLDGNYIAAGETGPNNVFIVKANVNGDTLWTKIFSGTDHEDAKSIQQTSDGGFIIAGNTASPELTGLNSYDIYLIKIMDSTVIASSEELNDVNNHHFYPNPANDVFIINSETELRNAVMTIYDVNGKIVKKLKVTGNKISVSRETLINGFYSYKITQDSIHLITGKFILAD